jgi:DNA-binding transcriptional LysR family regulator
MHALRGERWGVWNEKVFPGFGRSFLKTCREAGFRPTIANTVDSLASVFIQVAEGGFISYGPPFARQLPHPGVVFMPTNPPDAIDVCVLLVWPKNSAYTEPIRWLADAMEATLPRPKQKSADRDSKSSIGRAR